MMETPVEHAVYRVRTQYRRDAMMIIFAVVTDVS